MAETIDVNGPQPQAEEDYVQRMDSAGAEVYSFPTPAPPPEPPPPFITLGLNPTETLITFQAYRALLKHYAAQESEPLEQIQQLTALMATVKPAAVEASKLFQQEGRQPQ